LRCSFLGSRLSDGFGDRFSGWLGGFFSCRLGSFCSRFGNRFGSRLGLWSWLRSRFRGWFAGRFGFFSWGFHFLSPRGGGLSIRALGHTFRVRQIYTAFLLAHRLRIGARLYRLPSPQTHHFEKYIDQNSLQHPESSHKPSKNHENKACRRSLSPSLKPSTAPNPAKRCLWANPAR
jgi:hypothetical protein